MIAINMQGLNQLLKSPDSVITVRKQQGIEDFIKLSFPKMLILFLGNFFSNTDKRAFIICMYIYRNYNRSKYINLSIIIQMIKQKPYLQIIKFNKSVSHINYKVINKQHNFQKHTNFNSQILTKFKHNDFRYLIAKALQSPDYNESNPLLKFQQKRAISQKNMAVPIQYKTKMFFVNKNRQIQSKNQKDRSFLPFVSYVKAQKKQIISKTIENTQKLDQLNQHYSSIIFKIKKNKRRQIGNQMNRKIKIINKSLQDQIQQLNQPQLKRCETLKSRFKTKQYNRQKQMKVSSKQTVQKKIINPYSKRSILSILRPWQVEQGINSEILKQYVTNIHESRVNEQQ